MKRLSFTLALMLLALSASAQNYIHQPTEINVWPYIDEVGQEAPWHKNIQLQYDTDGRLSHYHHVVNYPNVDYVHNISFEYNDVGLLSKKHLSANEGSNAYTRDSYYSYDQDRQLRECRVESIDFFYGTVNPVSLDVYEYANGLKTRQYHYISEDPSTLKYYYVYEYSGLGVMTKASKYVPNDVLKETELYEYEQGRISTRLTLQWANGEVSSRIKDSYHYDDQGHCTQVLCQRWVNDGYQDYNRATYEYDDDGLCVHAFAQQWDGTDWVLGGFRSGIPLFFGDEYAQVNNHIGYPTGCTRAEVLSYELTPRPFVFLEPDSYICRPDSAILRYANPSDDRIIRFFYNSDGLLRRQESYNHPLPEDNGSYYGNDFEYDEHQNLVVLRFSSWA